MTTKGDDKPRDPIKDSAQQIWLAGLGAFAKMQQEGSKAFEALVKDGVGLQKKTQQAAEETLSQAQTRMAGLANEFGAKTSASSRTSSRNGWRGRWNTWAFRPPTRSQRCVPAWKHSKRN